MKNCTLAAALFFLAATTLPAQSPAHNHLVKGDKQYDQGNYAAAENAYRQAPGDAQANFNAGNAAFQQGKFEPAVKYYEAALSRQQANKSTNPQQADTWFNLGNAYLRLGKYREAVGAYQKSLRLQSTLPHTKKNLQTPPNKLN